jgi:hypothetical protein
VHVWREHVNLWSSLRNDRLEEAFRGPLSRLPSRERRPGNSSKIAMPSRPGEFRPEPLTDPDLILSHHPARATETKAAAFLRKLELILLPVGSLPDVGDPPPLLHGHYPASSLLRGSPPLAGASVFRPCGFDRLCLFPWFCRPSSQVPCKSPNESHASCTPDTVWPVGRFLPYSSRRRVQAPVLMSSNLFRCFIRGSLALVSLINT